jgi:chorismate--pyruvate lyase
MRCEERISVFQRFLRLVYALFKRINHSASQDVAVLRFGSKTEWLTLNIWSIAMLVNCSLLPPITWFYDQHPSIPASIKAWLMEVGSMTSRFERYCERVSVEPQRECFVDGGDLGEELEHLEVSQRYWLREIMLFGDNEPWLLGRTVIPEKTLTGPDQVLIDLGTVPLGRYLFGSGNLTRDYILIGQTDELWARRSRLRLAGKPLLLTEVFLSSSPIY